ncbi:MAG: VCBS repeat-containing protein [Deltaproteobacteria bacterium]|nr:VCBS repeat-containing protein [Deltaproteobacteria bacterium]
MAQTEKPKAKRHPSYSLRGVDEPLNPDSILNPNFVVSTESKISETSLWRSSYIPERLVGLDVGDVDNDGKNEMVYVTTRNVFVARYDGTTYTLLANFSLPANSTIISVDLFDANMDSRKEIFVSAQKVGTSEANTHVLAYTGGKTLDVLASDINYYVRVVGAVDRKILVSQKPGTNIGESYSGGVFYSSFHNGKISANSKVNLPLGVDIYNFNIGELGSERVSLTSYIRFPTEHLVLIDTGGGKVWESHDEYGGSINRIERLTTGDGGKNNDYLPTRIIYADIDKDGTNELIVAKNNLGGTRLFKNLRSFNSGSIEARKFVNLSLIPFFNSANLLPGPAVDYQLADFDNNGTQDLVVAVVIEPGSGMMKDARSIIFSYNNLYTVQPTATPVADNPDKK